MVSARCGIFSSTTAKLSFRTGPGIPISAFDQAKWSLRFFGAYAGPLEIFRKYAQPQLLKPLPAEQSGAARVRYRLSLEWAAINLIVATRKETEISPLQTGPLPQRQPPSQSAEEP